jgi:hypothetical protein
MNLELVTTRAALLAVVIAVALTLAQYVRV